MELVDRVLLIDDDAELGGMLKEYLRRQGVTVDVALSGDKGLQQFQKEPYALVLLDVMLPGRDGFEVLRELRQTSRVDVIMLTARGEDIDRILGLEMGADDYLPKPFNPRELLARIRAVQRRKDKRAPETRLQANGITLDNAERSVRWRGRAIILTTVEFEVLRTLLESAGQVVSKTWYDPHWGVGFSPSTEASTCTSAGCGKSSKVRAPIRASRPFARRAINSPFSPLAIWLTLGGSDHAQFLAKNLCDVLDH